jgi:hypothetical protein
MIEKMAEARMGRDLFLLDRPQNVPFLQKFSNQEATPSFLKREAKTF